MGDGGVAMTVRVLEVGWVGMRLVTDVGVDFLILSLPLRQSSRNNDGLVKRMSNYRNCVVTFTAVHEIIENTEGYHSWDGLNKWFVGGGIGR